MTVIMLLVGMIVSQHPHDALISILSACLIVVSIWIEMWLWMNRGGK